MSLSNSVIHLARQIELNYAAFTVIMLFQYIWKNQSLLEYLSSYQQLTINQLRYLPYTTIAQITE